LTSVERRRCSKDQIPLRYPGRRPVASWDLAYHALSNYSSRAGFRPVADRFELSRHVEIARTWSQTGSQLVCDLLAS